MIYFYVEIKVPTPTLSTHLATPTEGDPGWTGKKKTRRPSVAQTPSGKAGPWVPHSTSSPAGGWTWTDRGRRTLPRRTRVTGMGGRRLSCGTRESTEGPSCPSGLCRDLGPLVLGALVPTPLAGLVLATPYKSKSK